MNAFVEHHQDSLTTSRAKASPKRLQGVVDTPFSVIPVPV